MHVAVRAEARPDLPPARGGEVSYTYVLLLCLGESDTSYTMFY